MNKIFNTIGAKGGAEGLTTGTVMTYIQLNTYEKRSNLFTNDLSEGDIISSKTLGCAFEPMGTYTT
jgi:hypothetical protein